MAGEIKDAADKITPNAIDKQPAEVISSNKIKDKFGNEFTITVKKQRTIVTETTIAVTIYTRAGRNSTSRKLMQDRINRIRDKFLDQKRLNFLSAHVTRSTKGDNGVFWNATDAERGGKDNPNLVKLDITTRVTTVDTISTIIIPPPFKPDC